MNCLELDREIAKMARAMMTRNTQIGRDLIAYLRSQMTIEAVAGVLVVSIERVIWFDAESIIWTIENVIPGDIMQEIHRLTSVSIYKQLITKGYVPGKDMSVDANGKILLKETVRVA